MTKRKTILGIPKHGQPTSCAPSAPLGCSALNKRWKVAEAGDQYFMQSPFSKYPERFESTCEDMSILTEDGEEVIGCSEWMRAEREVFDYIVALHNANLQNPAIQTRRDEKP